MTSKSVNSDDKNMKVAMVAYTPQPVRPRGSNSIDKDSLRTMGLPWQHCTLGYMDVPWLPGVYGYCTLWWHLWSSHIMVQVTLSLHPVLTVWCCIH